MCSNENSKVSVEYELTPASQKVGAELNLPKEAANKLSDATSNLVNVLANSSEKVINMLCNGASTLTAPFGALLKGKTAEIELNNQSIYAKLAITKEINMRKLSAYVTQELNDKVNKGEEIPDSLEDSDNLILIQDNASTMSDEEFLKLWAKLYTQEACKPGSVSRKTIKILETMDSNVVKILEKDIFPYCDDKGFYWGKTDDISSLLLAMDYNLVQDGAISFNPGTFNASLPIRIDKEHILYCYPNYGYHAEYKGQMYRLTTPGLEVYRNLNKNAKKEDILKIIFNNISEASCHWEVNNSIPSKFSLKADIKTNEKFVICDNSKNVVYPENSPFKTFDEFYASALKNIELVNNL